MILVNEPLLEAAEAAYVEECVRSGWVSSGGPFVELFESSWAKYCGRRYGVAVTNGTAALELALSCLNLETGDEVLVPTFTIISPVLAILRSGAVPILVDSEPGTWCMDTEMMEAKITERTRAILPVHIYGHPVDMDAVTRIAERYDLRIVEDAAEAHGAEYLSCEGVSAKWRRCGCFGDLSCFSFYANKLVTTGEGGMVLTDDASLAERARSRRNLCFAPGRRFRHEELGYNLRFTSLQAALGLGQVQRIDQIVQRKRRLGAEYSRRLADLEGLELQSEESWARSVFWVFGVVLSDAFDFDAERLASELVKRGVETRPFFLGIHEQPVFRRLGCFVNESYPVAEWLARRGLYLPSGLALRKCQLERVCEALWEILG